MPKHRHRLDWAQLPKRAAAACLGAALLLGCDKPAERTEEIRPVRVETVVAKPGGTSSRYSGEIKPRYETALAFRVGGQINTRRVNVGDRVKAGTVIATLDLHANVSQRMVDETDLLIAFLTNPVAGRGDGAAQGDFRLREAAERLVLHVEIEVGDLRVDAALELVGAPTLRDTLRSTRAGGVVCFTGMLSNEWVIKDFYPIDFIPNGVRLTAYSGEARDLPVEVLQSFLDDVARGVAKVPLYAAFPLTDVARAHEIMEANTAEGKMVLLPFDDSG